MRVKSNLIKTVKQPSWELSNNKEADYRAKQQDNANNIEEEYALITTSNTKKT